jgi:tetratricopeptide (TPR) repeat protein
MYNLLISLGAALVTFLLFYSGIRVPLAGALLPAFVAGAVAYFFLARRTLRQLEAIVLAGTKEIEAGAKEMAPGSSQIKSPRIDKGIEKIKEGFSLGKWQFLVNSQVHSAVGSYLYMLKRFDEALPHLQKAFARAGQAKAMLGALYFQRKEYVPMAKAFEEAVTANKKDSLVWSVYAWCLDKAGQRVAALEVVGRGLKELPSDEKLKANQIALQNNERPKMKPYGQMWWAFHLEQMPMDHIPPGMRGQLQQRKGYRTFK